MATTRQPALMAERLRGCQRRGPPQYTAAPASLDPYNSDWTGVLEAPLTYDLPGLRNTVLTSSILTANKYNGWTPIGGAIRDSAHYLNVNARSNAKKVLVVMSDGHANKPSGYGPDYARKMASYANSLDTKLKEFCRWLFLTRDNLS